MAKEPAAITALRAQLDDATAALDSAKRGAVKARDAAKDAAEIWPEVAGAAVAGGLAGAGLSYDFEIMGVSVPLVPIGAGTALMLATKRGGMAARAGRGMLIAAGYELAAQLTAGVR